MIHTVVMQVYIFFSNDILTKSYMYMLNIRLQDAAYCRIPNSCIVVSATDY